jgi:cytochrome P450
VTSSLPFLDVLNPEFDFESAEMADARERNWYADSPMGPLVLRHREAEDLLRDHRFKLGGEGFMESHGITEGPMYEWWTTTLMSVDPPDHARLRRLLNKAFTPRVVEALRPITRTTAVDLADRIAAGGGECEFVSAFSDPLPALVMCELLGVPAEDYDKFHHWANDLGLGFSRADLGGALLARVDAAVAAMTDYVAGLIVERRKNPGSDLLTAMITAQEAGETLTVRELHNLTLLLVWAGQDTTARQLGRALVVFADHPEQWELLARRPDLLPQAVEEVCRWSPQARMTWRYALEDVQYKDLLIPRGTRVTSCNAPANRDPRAFEDAHRFDITIPRKAKQLVFGGGVYYCLGVALARLELAEALEVLTSRFGPPTITGPITWRPPMAVIHGPDALPLSLPVRRTGVSAA